jgi:hypothetical protein
MARRRTMFRRCSLTSVPVTTPQWIDPTSAVLQLLCEHHEDAARAADVGQLVEVFVDGDAAQRVAAVPRGDLKGIVDVVDRGSVGRQNPGLVGS